MDKRVDFNKTIFQLSQENPEIVEIMQELGFEDIGNPSMMNTVGRVMTLSKGARMKKININRIKEVFRSKGYEIIE